MDKKIAVIVDGNSIDLPIGATLRDAIQASKAPYWEGNTVGILKKSDIEKEENIAEYKIVTTAGEFTIEIIQSQNQSEKRWSEFFTEYKNIPVRWVSKDALAFGPFESNMIPTRGMSTYEQFDVFFAAGGGDAHNSHIIMVKENHTAEYGAPEEGIFAKVVSGKQVIRELKNEDKIVDIQPIIAWKKVGEHIVTDDLTQIIENGEKIFTHVNIEISPDSPHGAEHFYAVIRNGIFKVDMVSSSFIEDDLLLGELATYENYEPRTRGSVCIRTVGYGAGKAFISKDDRTASILHSVIGTVTSGMELVDMAENGHSLIVYTQPPQIMLHGKTFKEALEELKPLGIQLERDGNTQDDALIVSQNPDTTIDIFKNGTVIAVGEDAEKIISIELFDDIAPKSVEFFRHAVGLQFRPIGILPLVMMYENTFIFKADKPVEQYKEILPENTPIKIISGDIGITNQAAKRMGMIGVKNKDDDLFGPTGEKFTSTNIVGRILDINKLDKFKEGEKIYVVERNREKNS